MVKTNGKLKMEKKRLVKKKLLRKKREKFTIEQRAKFLHDTIGAQGNFLLNKEFDAIGLLRLREVKELNKDPKKKRVIKETLRKEYTTKVHVEQEVTEQADDKHKMSKDCTFDSTIDSEIMETKSFITRLHKVSSPDGNYLVVYRVNGHFRAFNYLMERIESSGYGILSFIPFVVFGKCRHGYTVSSMMGTAYWSSE
ncbi:hypothetical protein Tco_0245832 [Tanacetum coccineum]